MSRKLVSMTCICAGTACLLPGTVMAGTDFTGFYVGAGVGAAYLNLSTERSDRAQDNNFNETNMNGRLYVGYGERMGRFYIGLEGDIGRTFGSLEYSQDLSPSGPQIISTELDTSYVWGADLMAGYMAVENTMLYGKIGYEFAPTEVNVRFGSAGGFPGGAGSVDRDFSGVRLGFGLATGLDESTVLRLEYRAALYGEESITYAGPGVTPVNEELDLTRHEFSLNVDYRF